MTVSRGASVDGDRGVVAICSTHAGAEAAAEAAVACSPQGLAIYLGNGDEPCVVHAVGDVRALTSAVDDQADVALI